MFIQNRNYNFSIFKKIKTVILNIYTKLKFRFLLKIMTKV